MVVGHGPTPMALSRHVGQEEHPMDHEYCCVRNSDNVQKYNKVFKLQGWCDGLEPNPHMIFQESRAGANSPTTFICFPIAHDTIPSLSLFFSLLQFSHYHVHILYLLVLPLSGSNRMHRARCTVQLTGTWRSSSLLVSLHMDDIWTLWLLENRDTCLVKC